MKVIRRTESTAQKKADALTEMLLSEKALSHHPAAFYRVNAWSGLLSRWCGKLWQRCWALREIDKKHLRLVTRLALPQGAAVSVIAFEAQQFLLATTIKGQLSLIVLPPVQPLIKLADLKNAPPGGVPSARATGRHHLDEDRQVPLPRSHANRQVMHETGRSGARTRRATAQSRIATL